MLSYKFKPNANKHFNDYLFQEIPHLSADVLPTTGIPPNTRMLPRADMSPPASTAIPWPSLHGALPTSPRLREAESTLAEVKVLSPSRKLSIQSKPVSKL